MEIKLNSNSFSYNLEIKDTNVFIEEDVTERTWIKDEKGRAKHCKMDISNEGLSMIATVMEDMIYYRELEYDSSILIERLFEKLPAEIMQTLLVELNKYKKQFMKDMDKFSKETQAWVDAQSNKYKEWIKRNNYPIGGFAPGNYTCKCVTCNEIFQGDKRAVQCEPCAIKEQNFPKANIIDTWLEKNGDPEISKQVGREAEQLELEEAAENYCLSKFGSKTGNKSVVDGIYFGANWMAERMKSEVYTVALEAYIASNTTHNDGESLLVEFNEWFEQFKK